MDAQLNKLKGPKNNIHHQETIVRRCSILTKKKMSSFFNIVQYGRGLKENWGNEKKVYRLK